MRKSLILLTVAISFLPFAAQAENSLFGHDRGRAVWSHYTKFNPYLENGTQAHNDAWTSEGWSPPDWTAQRRNGLELVSGFYKSDIIRDQSVEDDVSVIVVGPNFYRIGSEDKYRVVASMNEVYGITAQKDNGTILLRDWHTNRDIGVFTQSGLMLQ